MLPDVLEKHCIQAEPILDKNALAGKKEASAHLLLWICRRFSTDAAVLQVFCKLSVCMPMQRLPALACHPALLAIDCRQEAVVLSFAGVGLATFFLKTKNTRAVLALPFAWFSTRSRFLVLVNL